MKKLLFISLCWLFTQAVTAQITTYSPYCCTAGISVTAGYFSRPAPLNHYWTIQASDAFGNPSSGILHTSATFSGGSGTYSFPSSVAGTLCGGYGLVTLYVEKSGTPFNYWLSFTSVITVTSLSPVISGSTSICGTGTYCATGLTGSGYTYDWQACVGVVTQWNGPNTNCVTVPAMAWNNMLLQVTDANGCQSGYVSQLVTNSYIDPSFYISSIGAVDATHFKVAFQRAASAGSTSDAFKVEEVGSSSPYTPVSGSDWSNPGWAATPNWYSLIYIYNYDGDYNPPYNSPYNYPYGHFRNDRTYRITRTIDNGGCISTRTIVFNSSGVVCYNCRTADENTGEAEMENTNSFTVFPNPTNGSFQVKFDVPAENAQAELFNIMGERVDGFSISGDTYSYTPAQTLAAGVYMLRINNKGVMYTQRIVVE